MARITLYADLNKIEPFYLKSLQGDERPGVQTLRAVGLSGTASGDEATFSLRVLFDRPSPGSRGCRTADRTAPPTVGSHRTAGPRGGAVTS
ncbi:hypothetical protein [Streptosporangium pseudovulgare]|uniref:Uncharacterized protein n=1 Tax=Streptosporangium pseudovulgare TaxID=35765 RepID=A0ABQ2QMX2_9ACTN|nr:hypothetical protein [Streptosporangium pseudovulgare]GGP88714.1 hypothetical protein GCM10010140_18070 [Streptosporangium pseudovulgare]